ncbi:hypothetical protein H8S17_03030 [Roseburia sp. BX1005]|uniref:Reverse transcriptase domain-containing protein n=1 Tax=Roseburia zhanii TaxID=2763064 RepID=A0A923LMX5_9FIRM|nr:CRISPR-associated primase-polymerase type A1 [Roseburia zhanii]MBC5713190.1 hypothetical protein [Roseburia zhanii]
MRDKVVQQMIVQEISQIYEPLLSPNAYAYRPGKSALSALEYITGQVEEHTEYGVLKTDIRHFFDCIDREILIEKLKEKISDEKFLYLLKTCLSMRYVNAEGELHERKDGIYQGSLLAPVLSNIYMMEFDKIFAKQCLAYVRYSDDIICICPNVVDCESLLKNIKMQMSLLKLEIKDAKTSISKAGEGFEFLGYHISDTGKMIPVKATNQLTERLEDLWLNSNETIEKKLSKGREIIGGWEQYYREEREMASIYEYVIAISLYPVETARKNLLTLQNQRFQFDNIHKDIAEYLVHFWLKMKMPVIALKEYEQYYQVLDLDMEKIQKISDIYLKELLQYYHLAMIKYDDNILTEIMQIYTDIGCYNKARKITEYERVLHEEKPVYTERSESHFSNVTIQDDTDSGQADISLFVQKEMYAQKVPHLNEEDVKRYIELFVGREDCYAKASVNYNGKLVYDQVQDPLLEDVILQHLHGEAVIASYIQRNNNTVKFIVFDVDLSKKTLLQIGNQREVYQQYMNKALGVAKAIKKILAHFGIEAVLEFSGYRGYHIWIFVEEWISARYANLLQDAVIKNLTIEREGINVECFPNRTRTRGDKLGQALKLPWAKHFISEQYSLFVDSEGQILENQKDILHHAVTYSISKLKRIIAANTGEQLSIKTEQEIIDKDEYKNYGEMIQLVLLNCGLARHLYQKAKSTGYLTHSERLTILYIFGHLGESGKGFVHTVMEFTLNYQYSVTQRYISKLPDKPISCNKLREQYKQLTAQVGCNCRFVKTRDCYPSPVLHALKNAKDIPKDINLPTSQSKTKSDDNKICKQVNIHKQASEIAAKLVELRRQERGVKKAIDKQQESLNELFDTAGVDCLEIDIGLLIRRKVEEGYEYSIEI